MPELKKQVNELRSDNVYLTGLIKRNEENKIRTTIDNNQPPDLGKKKGPAPQPPQRRSLSVSLSVPTSEILATESNRVSPVPSKRLTRSPVVTRDIGVTTQKATTHSVGTNSETRLYTEEELEAIVQQVIAKQKKARAIRCVNSSTQLGASTFLTKASRSAGVQTNPKSNSVATMTMLETPKIKDCLKCLKCLERKHFDSTCLPAPVISLEFMDILPHTKKTTTNQSNQTPIVTMQNIAIQATVPIKTHCSKSTQSTPTVGIHFGSQHSPPYPVLKHKLTETHGLLVHHHKASGPDQTIISRSRVIDKSTNTLQPPQSVQASTSTELTQSCDVGSVTDTSFSTDSSRIQFHCPNGCPKDATYCEACKQAIRSISREIGLNFATPLQKSGSSHSLSGSSPVSEYSRIPRPTTLMSPRPERRFDRQTTYNVPKKATTPTRSGRPVEEDFVKTCPAEEILR